MIIPILAIGSMVVSGLFGASMLMDRTDDVIVESSTASTNLILVMIVLATIYLLLKKGKRW